MFAQHFNLNELPFRQQASAGEPFGNPALSELQLWLRDRARLGTGATLLMGENGAGKSIQMNRAGRLLEQPDDGGPPVVVLRPERTLRRPSQLLQALAQDAHAQAQRLGAQGGDAGASTRDASSAEQLRETIARICKLGFEVAVLLDDADKFGNATLSELLDALGDETGARLSVSLLMAARPSFAPRFAELASDGARACLADADAHMMPLLEPADVHAYVEHELAAAGASGLGPFLPAAVDVVAANAYGVMGRVNSIAGAALLIAYDLDEKTVTAEMVTEALADLDELGDDETRDASHIDEAATIIARGPGAPKSPDLVEAGASSADETIYALRDGTVANTPSHPAGDAPSPGAVTDELAETRISRRPAPLRADTSDTSDALTRDGLEETREGAEHTAEQAGAASIVPVLERAMRQSAERGDDGSGTGAVDSGLDPDASQLDPPAWGPDSAGTTEAAGWVAGEARPRHDSKARPRHDSNARLRHDSKARLRHDSKARLRHDSKARLRHDVEDAPTVILDHNYDEMGTLIPEAAKPAGGHDVESSPTVMLEHEFDEQGRIITAKDAGTATAAPAGTGESWTESQDLTLDGRSLFGEHLLEAEEDHTRLPIDSGVSDAPDLPFASDELTASLEPEPIEAMPVEPAASEGRAGALVARLIGAAAVVIGAGVFAWWVLRADVGPTAPATAVAPETAAGPAAGGAAQPAPATLSPAPGGTIGESSGASAPGSAAGAPARDDSSERLARLQEERDTIARRLAEAEQAHEKIQAALEKTRERLAKANEGAASSGAPADGATAGAGSSVARAAREPDRPAAGGVQSGGGAPAAVAAATASTGAAGRESAAAAGRPASTASSPATPGTPAQDRGSATAALPLATTRPVQSAAPSNELYVVQRGDSLYRIGQRYGLTTDELARWNDLENPDRLMPGDRLRLTAP